jgi:hypothetical protein
VACDYETLRGGGGCSAATHDEGAKASCEEGRVNGGLQIFEGCDHLYVLLVFQCISIFSSRSDSALLEKSFDAILCNDY